MLTHPPLTAFPPALIVLLTVVELFVLFGMEVQRQLRTVLLRAAVVGGVLAFVSGLWDSSYLDLSASWDSTSEHPSGYVQGGSVSEAGGQAGDQSPQDRSYQRIVAAEETLELHYEVGRLLLVALFITLFFFELEPYAGHRRGILCWLYRATLALTLALVVYAGYLGGSLVFEHGLGVTPGN